MTQAEGHPLFDKHIDTLRKAIAAAETRTYWSPHPETHGHRGERAMENGREAFDSFRDASFYLDQPGVIDRVGSEQSPYGLPLNINYPQCSADALIIAARNGMTPWMHAGPDARTGVCLEILAQLHQHGMEIAHAVMHTTGQAFVFAYQHSLAGALDRGLEALASAYREMKQVPSRTTWERPQGKQPALKIEKEYTIAPRGVALNIGSASDPTWAAWPGMFASLSTGNPVIVQPDPKSILPLAITVAIARQVIKEAGFDPGLISLLVDDASSSSSNIVGLRPEIRIVDSAGDNGTSNWLEENAHQAAIFSLKTGANCVVVDSTGDYKGLLRNLAFGICMNSGQPAATPRLILVSREGVRTADGNVTAEHFGRDLGFTIGKLVENEARAAEILGAVQSAALLDAIKALRDAEDLDEEQVLRDSYRLAHPQWPAALIATPMLIKQTLTEDNTYLDRPHALVAFVAEAATTAEALTSAERVMREKGAIHLSVYTDSVPLQQLAQDIAARVGVTLNLNFTGTLLTSHTQAFSDFYATGENPASTCSLIDAAFVARRFFVVQTRRQVG